MTYELLFIFVVVIIAIFINRILEIVAEFVLKREIVGVQERKFFNFLIKLINKIMKIKLSNKVENVLLLLAVVVFLQIFGLVDTYAVVISSFAGLSGH